MWLKTVPVQDGHVCQKPSMTHEDYQSFGPGSRWMCDFCGTQWQIVEWTTPAGWHDLHPVWRVVNP